MSIPFSVLYNSDKDGVANILPSDRRNINIINGVKFGKILGYIQSKDMNSIESWIKEYEYVLTTYLKKKHNTWKHIDLGKYCTNLNYIIDFIVQGIDNLKVYESVSWIHQVDTISKVKLPEYIPSNCIRDVKNSENKDLFFKKLMLDLCEDIEYIEKKNKLLKNKDCPKILSRLKYREKTLMEFFDTFYHKSMFYQNIKCSIDSIHKNLSNISCNQVGEKPNTIGASKGERDTASSSVHTANTQPEGRITGTPEEGASETEALKDSGPDDGLDNSEQVDTFPDDLKFSLPFKEDTPKLNTTYAAASLAGISLFGTILYKYGPSGFWIIPQRGARIRSNVFPLGNNLYDASIMDNFEYLQTGIPNGQYRVGYGSVTH